MRALRPSDHAIAAACALVLWLLVRTALRAEVGVSVAATALGHLGACALRRAAGERRADPTIPLYAWLLGLVLVRALEDRWGAGADGWGPLVATCACVAAGAAWPARPRIAAGIFLTTVASTLALGNAAWAASAALLIALARGSAIASRRSSVAWWTLTLLAAGWACRGATIGPFAWMIGAGCESALVHAERDRQGAGRAMDLVEVFALASVGAWTLWTRAWERSALLFL
jgi:hypothetical protein